MTDNKCDRCGKEIEVYAICLGNHLICEKCHEEWEMRVNDLIDIFMTELKEGKDDETKDYYMEVSITPIKSAKDFFKKEGE